MVINVLKYIVTILIVVLAFWGGLTPDRLPRGSVSETVIKSLGIYLAAVGLSTIGFKLFFKENIGSNSIRRLSLKRTKPQVIACCLFLNGLLIILVMEVMMRKFKI